MGQLSWRTGVLFALMFTLSACGDNSSSVKRPDATELDGSEMEQDALEVTELPDEVTDDDAVELEQVDELPDLLPPVPDEDGDRISDEHEGDGDADGDGIPNYLDLDSDGDGILDKDEAGDDDVRTPPVDTDGDGIPDFLDTDSDNNGVPDSVEGVVDIDGDGKPNYIDFDNDGDGMPDVNEIEGGGADCNHDGLPDPPGTPENPRDCDRDGIPDYNTPDSDGDTISDRQEGLLDTDKDGFLDRYELDSDNDGIPDSVEAGDARLETPPIDSDGDLIPDYRDLDSDADGLSDALELQHGTNPRLADSDGDGVSDLIEVAAGTDPNDPDDSPRLNGDFVFILPYQKETEPLIDTLEFSTSIQFADIYFGFDRSNSMQAEVLALSGQLSTIINQLSCAETATVCRTDADCLDIQVCGPNERCIANPTLGDGCIANLWTGFGHWEELDTFVNRVSLQPNPVVTSSGLAGMDYLGWAEAPFQAPACVANADNCSNEDKGCTSSGVGCVGFRSNAIRIYIQVTDADDQCLGERCSTFTAAYAGAQLIERGIKFIGLYGFGPNADEEGIGTAESTARDIALASGTLDQAGLPLIYPALDAEVVIKTVLAVRELSRGVPLSVTIEAIDLPDDQGDALQFIDYLEVNVSGNGRCSVVSPLADTDGDGRNDAFPRLLPGTPICWDVHPVASNTTVPAIATPQLFKAQLTVSGDGSPLDSRNVFFLVPPDIYGQIN